jgi:hypothetical protein
VPIEVPVNGFVNQRDSNGIRHTFTDSGAFDLLAVLGKFYAIPAVAQALRTAVVKNIDEPGRNKYQATVQCAEAIFGHYDTCQAYGTPVPAGSRLVVQNVDLTVSYDPRMRVCRASCQTHTLIT